jgi:hypothetical protein
MIETSLSEEINIPFTVCRFHVNWHPSLAKAGQCKRFLVHHVSSGNSVTLNILINLQFTMIIIARDEIK